MNKLILILLVCSNFVIAGDFKLGYINVDRVFAESSSAKKIQQAMKDKFSKKQQELESLNTTLATEQKDIQQINSKAVSFDKLSQSDQTQMKKLQTQFQKDQMNFQQQYPEFQRSVQKAQELALSLMMGKINGILKILSEKNGYDLLLTSNQIVYAKSKYDVTDQVMAQINSIDTGDIIKQINTSDLTKQPAK